MLLDEIAVAIKKLNNEKLLALFTNARIYNNWIKQNNINLKNDKEAVQFLNYYNRHY